MVRIIGKEVGPIGVGLMSLTRPGSGVNDEQAFAVLRRAIELEAFFWNGGEFYGPENANSLVLLEKYFAKYPEDADKVVLSIKGGSDKPNTFHFDSSPANVRRSVNDCVEQLKGRKTIDLFELARHDGVTPWETSVKSLLELKKEGKLGHLSLSEVRAESIHRVAKVAKIEAVEIELSIVSPEVLTNGVTAACSQYDIPVIAYSPIGHGLLTGHIKSQDDLNWVAKMLPRFSQENLPANLKLVEQIEKIAADKGCTTGQLAINWVRCLSRRPGMPTIVPLPGTTTIERLEENLTLVDFSDEEMDTIDDIISNFEVKGDRYPSHLPTET
ncbi:aldo-keto reductase [Grosmannia clavigera kw1407]|uniref:Aldo-keto reductase n=1 Tax=Grosmannia clavigera (strain kw1407 / UAMH 11150) TaxID=655863 RepID=F0XCT7_GROCL|nr:aldo-keto reductase [Grosmannia clavigera kw1407]EFX04790.1 aldo-keto reductase [Grosmannia clavigera kw1407]